MFSDGKQCPQALEAISHSVLSCENVATEHKYTVQEKVEKEKCEDVPADDSSGGDKSEETTKKERKINKETETEMKKKTEGDKSSETTTKKVCKTVTETVSKEMTNTTYNTTCSLQCKAGYAFRFKSFFLGCLSNYLDRNKHAPKCAPFVTFDISHLYYTLNR